MAKSVRITVNGQGTITLEIQQDKKDHTRLLEDIDLTPKQAENLGLLLIRSSQRN